MMPQMPSREKLLAWIDQVSFAVVEMNAEQYDPLTIDTANDRMSRSFEWVMQPWPWEVNRKGGC